MLGTRIKELRIAKDLTQEELGKLLGVGKTTISQYESGSRNPDADMVRRLAELFKVSTDYLLGVQTQTNLPDWLTKVPKDLREQIEDMVSTGDMGAIYLRAGIGMAKDAKLVDYPPEALEAIARAAIDGGTLVRQKKAELKRAQEAKDGNDE